MKFEPVQKKDKLNRIVILRSADAEDGGVASVYEGYRRRNAFSHPGAG